MASTTLITFLVRTPASTRSVSLLGSWDNFQRPYIMKRDSRVGPEHWSGCHSFENIFCDGMASSTSAAREGGLKMGGTYWYYYKLDDEIEFHNSAEESTTACPYLPGQLVNVLHVPIYLSGGRKRNASVSSTSSDLRTMNPQDKFLNPRPVPQPKLPRLNTSHVLSRSHIAMTDSPTGSSPWSTRSASASRAGSQPGSAVSLRMFRLPRKTSIDGRGRSTSPTAKASGIRAAFRQLTSPSSPSQGVDYDSGHVFEPERELSIGAPLQLSWEGSQNTSRAASRNTSMTRSGNTSRAGTAASSRSTSTERGPQRHAESASGPAQLTSLALRRGLDEAFDPEDRLTIASFQHHRRERSRSREPSALRRSLSVSDDPTADTEIATTGGQNYQPLETVKEVHSALNTPTWPLTAIKIPFGHVPPELDVTLETDKRLPTLPNSPSSAYPQSAASDAPSRRFSDEIENLQSHFSATTVASTSWVAIHDDVIADKSRFSECTMASTPASPASDSSSDLLSDGLCESPVIHPDSFPHCSSATENPYVLLCTPQNERAGLVDAKTSLTAMATTHSYSTISSATSTSPPSPDSEAYGAERAINEMSATTKRISSCGLQTYKLPEIGEVLTADRKPPSLEESVAELPRVHVRRQESISNAFPGLMAHSESMQQLLNELSYLGDIIQR